MNTPDRLTWRTPVEAVRVVVRPPHLWRTVLTALVVGTILLAINQLNNVLAGHAGAESWVKTGVTYVVPFVVSNVGLLVGSRHP